MGLIERLLLFLNGESIQSEKGIGFLAEENQQEQKADGKSAEVLEKFSEKKAQLVFDDNVLGGKAAGLPIGQSVSQSDVMGRAIVGQEDVTSGEGHKGNGGGIGFIEASAERMGRKGKEEPEDAQWTLGQYVQAQAQEEVGRMAIGSMATDSFFGGAKNAATGNSFSTEGARASGKPSPITQQGNRDMYGLLTKIYEGMQGGESSGNSAPHVSLHLEQGRDGADIDSMMEAVSQKLWEARQSGMKRRRGE